MKFSFLQNKIVDRFNFHELSEINQVQFLIAGRNAWGPAKSSLLDIFSAGDIGEQMVWEYFKVTDIHACLHVYDAWILAGDSGTIFNENSAVSADIEMCQSYIDSVSDSEQTLALAADLRKAYKMTTKAFETENRGFDSIAFSKYWTEFYKKKGSALENEEYWTDLTKKLEQKILL